MKASLDERILAGKIGRVFSVIVCIMFLVFATILFKTDKKVPAIVLCCVAVVFAMLFFVFGWKNKKLQKQLEEENEQNAPKIELYPAKMKKYLKDRFYEDLSKDFANASEEIAFTEADLQRIEKNCQTIETEELPCDRDLKAIPCDATAKLRSQEEIMQEMIGDIAMANRALSKVRKDPTEVYVVFQNKAFMLYRSSDLLDLAVTLGKGEYDTKTLTTIGTLYYRVGVYMWVLGLTDETPSFTGAISEQSLDKVLLGIKNKEDFRNCCRMRGYEEIVSYADLATRYEWALMELQKMENVRADFVSESIIQQKRALDFVTSAGANM